MACSGCRGAKRFRTLGAGADAAQVIVAVDAGGVAVGEGDLNGVVADGGSLLRARLGLEHRQSRCGGGVRASRSALSDPLVVASGTRAFFAKIREIIMAGMTIGPGDVDAGSASHMNFYGAGFFSGVDGNGHELVHS